MKKVQNDETVEPEVFGNVELLLLLLLIRQRTSLFSGERHGAEHVPRVPHAEAVLRRVVLCVSLSVSNLLKDREREKREKHWKNYDFVGINYSRCDRKASKLFCLFL
jgi:hypothetical protein